MRLSRPKLNIKKNQNGVLGLGFWFSEREVEKGRTSVFSEFCVNEQVQQDGDVKRFEL